MNKKIILVGIDGMRPNAIDECGHPFLHFLKKEAASSMNVQTVDSSYTLPSYASLFFSVGPDRHGLLTDKWSPIPRPIPSIGDTIYDAGGKTAMFYNWESLRDLNRPGKMNCSHFESLVQSENSLNCDNSIADKAIQYLKSAKPDFLFLYLGVTSHMGREFGWMSKEYLSAVANASACIENVFKTLSADYSLIVMSAYSGPEHDLPEDATVPVIFYGRDFTSATQIDPLSIIDIAPTITDVLGIKRPAEWQGKSIL